MKKIVILGASVAGVKAAESIRITDQESEITIISFDGDYPANRDLFPELIAKSVKPAQLLYQSKEFYAQQKINLILKQVPTRINLKRNKIHFEDKTQIDFDQLLITETAEPKFPDIRGTNKLGIFSCYRLQKINEIIKALPLLESVVVQSDSFYGLRIAHALSRSEKEVVLVTSHPHLLAPYWNLEAAQSATGILGSKGVQVICGATISEILGDAEAKAVRLTSGKVIAGDMIVFAETGEDLRIFSDDALGFERKITVDANFKTSFDHVYALDKTFQVNGQALVVENPTTAQLEYQGQIIAAQLQGRTLELAPPISEQSLIVDGLELHLKGSSIDLPVVANAVTSEPVTNNQ